MIWEIAIINIPTDNSIGDFLFILFLANFQRGIVRHGFAEGQDTFLTCTFYLASAVFMLSSYNFV